MQKAQPFLAGLFFRLMKTCAVVTWRKDSTQVFANQPCQFKHRDLVFAKHRFEFGIGVDGAFGDAFVAPYLRYYDRC